MDQTNTPEIKPVSFDAPIEGARIEPTPLAIPREVFKEPSSGLPKSEQQPADTVSAHEPEAATSTEAQSDEKPSDASAPKAEQPANKEEPITDEQFELVKELIDEPDLQVNQIVITKREFEHLYTQLRKFYPNDEQVNTAKDDPTSLYSLVMAAMGKGWGSNQLQSYLEVLAQNETYKKLVAASDKTFGSFGDGRTSKLNTGVDVTGEEARNAFAAALSGLLRVKLLNSGFWVAVRRPLMHELQDLYDIVDLEAKEIGYSIGAHFALIADMYLKMRFVQALIKFRIIVDSNLIDIYKGNTFVRALSFHDYEVLLHAVLSLMAKHKDHGLRCRMVCPACGHVEINDKIDVKSAKYYNRDLLAHPGLQEWWSKTKDAKGNPIRRTVDECRKYQEEVLAFTKTFEEDFDGTIIRSTLRVPTMAQYFDAGEVLVERIRKVIDEQSAEDEERRQVLMANLAAHTYQMIVPWIQRIEKIDDGEVSLRTSDLETLINVFDPTNQQNNHDPMAKFAEFLGESRIAWIGTYALECPSCHAKPDVGLDQFYPLEVQTIFFGLLFRQLPLEIMQTAVGS